MASFSDDDDLDVVWPRFVERLTGIAKWDLKSRAVLKPEEIVDKINPAKRDDGSTSREGAKKVFNRALHCLKTFGQIAASGASVVFGPANQCMNAVSFVIDASQRYSAVFDDLTTLMERMTVFFNRLEIYLTGNETDAKLNKHLRAQVYGVLAHFLEIMAIAHKLTTGHSGKLKLAFKAGIFGEDDGVRDALKKLETMIADVTGTEVSVIAKDLSQAAKNIMRIDEKVDQVVEASERTVVTLGHLANAEDRRSEVEREKKETEAIRKFLRIKENTQPWQDAHDELSRTRIPGTGTWLINMAPFARWCQPSEQTVNVVTLQGNQYYGKSYLCSAVVDDLNKRHEHDPKVHVAYYYFNRDPGESRYSINKAIKAIFWQIAQGERQICRDLRKLMARVADKKSDSSKTAELWDSLVTSHRAETEGTLFMIIDGINESDSEAGQPVAALVGKLMTDASAGSGLQIRVLLSGRPQGLQYLNDNLESRPPEINLSSQRHASQMAPNHYDIDLYTAKRLDDMPKFKDFEFGSLKDRIRVTLTSGVKGDYYTLDSKLKEIEQARLPSQIEDILMRADEDRTSVILRDIRRLNVELEPEEVAEVNKLLTWTLCARVPLRLDDLEAILDVDRDPNAFVGLQQQIEERYAALFVIDQTDSGTYLRIGSYDIENLIGTIQPTGLDPAEIAMVERAVKQHLRHTFGDEDDLFIRYNFADFFQSKRIPPTTVIHYNRQTAHANAALQCLLALCDSMIDPRFQSFHTYAFDWFAEHLENQMEVGVVPPDTARAITRKLVRLLYDVQVVDRWMENWLNDRSKWVTSLFWARCLQGWIMGTKVDKALEDMPAEREWIRTREQEGVSSIKYLSRVTEAIGRAWYNTKHEEPKAIFRWLRAYTNLQDGEESNAYDAIWAFDRPPANAINKTEERIRPMLWDCWDAYQWDMCISDTFSIWDYHDEALTRLDSALERQPDSWRARLQRAKELDLLGRTREAAQSMSKLVDDSRSKLEDDEDLAFKFWDSMLPCLSQYSVHTKQYSAAEAVDHEMLKRCYEHGFKPYATDALEDLLENYEATEQLYKSTELIMHLAEQKDDDMVFLSLMIKALSDDGQSRFLPAALRTTEARNKTMQVCEDLVKTIREETDDNAPAWMDIQFLVATLKWRGAYEDRDAAHQILHDMTTFTPPPHSTDLLEINWYRRTAAQSLSSSLLADWHDSRHTVEEKQGILDRMEKLTNEDHNITRDPEQDTRIPLARALHCSGEDDRARELLRGHLRQAIQKIEAGPKQDIQDRCDAMFRMASVFMHLDDDENALIAWSWMRMLVKRIDRPPLHRRDLDPTILVELQEVKKVPKTSRSQSTEADTTTKGLGSESNATAGATNESSTETAGRVAKTDAADHDELVEGPEEIEYYAPLHYKQQPVDDPPPVDGPADADTADAPTSDSEIDSDAVSVATSASGDAGYSVYDGLLQQFCDNCDKRDLLRYEFYRCHDCFDVGLCADCFAKYNAGRMTRLLCEPWTCSHLRMPPIEEFPFGREDQVLVAGKPSPLADWLDGVKREWGIQDAGLSPKERFRAVVWKIRVGLGLDKEYKAKLNERAMTGAQGLATPPPDERPLLLHQDSRTSNLSANVVEV